MLSQFALYHAWLIPLLPAISFLVVGLIVRRCRFLSAGFAILMSTVSFALAIGVAFAVVETGIVVEEPFVQRIPWVNIAGLHIDMGVLIDPLTAMMLVVVTLVSLLVQIYSIGYMHGDDGFGRFFAYLSLFAASMLGLVIAVNFVQMFVFWELVGLCSYLLIGYYFHRISAREAAKKAFITTRAGDFGLLLGILLLQITFGTLDFLALREMVPAYILTFGTAFLTGVALLIFIGPIGKSGQFPLHVWLPDAMEGPTPVSALIHAATMVVAGVYLIARSYFLFSELPLAMDVIAWVGAFTALFAASIAFTQREIKRILAYSTVSQLGYMMLALGVGSLTASMFHLMTHAFFKALLFLGAGAVMHALKDEADIFKMGGLAKKMPVTFAAMTIGVLAISGIPPFAGFFSKDEILAAAAAVSTPLYLVAAATAFMTAFYMARLLFVAFLGEPNGSHDAHESPYTMKIPLIVLSILAVASGLWAHESGFGEWVRFGSAHSGGIDWTIAISSTLLSLLAMGLAWKIYVKKQWSADAIAERFGAFYTWSFHKYYVDEFYALLTKYFVDGIGRLLYWVDLYIVDGIVNALARITDLCGAALNRLQSGQVQQYAAVFFSGAIALLAVSLLYAYKVLAYLRMGGAL